MAFVQKPLEPYGYNIQPPPDDGRVSPENRPSWAGLKAKLTDPLVGWISAINAEIARAMAEADEFTVRPSTLVLWAGTALFPGYAYFNASYSRTTYARLYAYMGDIWRKDEWGYKPTPDDGTMFITPPFQRYLRIAGHSSGNTVWPGQWYEDANKSHVHKIKDDGHMHLMQPGYFWSPGGDRSDTPNGEEAPYNRFSEAPSTERQGTGIIIEPDGESEAHPKTIVCNGLIKA